MIGLICRTSLETIKFKMSPGVDSGRVEEFMSLIGCVPGGNEAEHLSKRRSTKASEGVADVAPEELSKFLLADSELPVSRREFPCLFEKRKKTQAVGWGFWSKEVAVEVVEAIGPLDGIIAYQTRECGGDVAEHGVVKVVESSVRGNDAEFAAKNPADFGSDSVFYSGSEPENGGLSFFPTDSSANMNMVSRAAWTAS
jgi:hypothetical protein